ILARDVSLSRERPAPTSILNLLQVRVLEISDDGPSRVNVQLSLLDGSTRLLSRITRRSRAALALEPGTQVYAQVKSVALLA
ncbi:MAG TPA: TOBE domain-containing protein, partial [Polyangiaceae bacterium]|nr:TOBE domain-containing protein [Polyangiaceae bacterium]